MAPGGATTGAHRPVDPERLERAIKKYLRTLVDETSQGATISALQTYLAGKRMVVSEEEIWQVLREAKRDDGDPRFLFGEQQQGTDVLLVRVAPKPQRGRRGQPRQGGRQGAARCKADDRILRQRALMIGQCLEQYIRGQQGGKSAGVPLEDALRHMEPLGDKDFVMEVIRSSKHRDERLRFELVDDLIRATPRPSRGPRSLAGGSSSGTPSRRSSDEEVVVSAECQRAAYEEDLAALAAADAAAEGSDLDVEEEDEILTKLRLKLLALDKAVAGRDVQEVRCERLEGCDDRQLVHEIGHLLEGWIQTKGWKDASEDGGVWPLFGGGKADIQPGIMSRLGVFIGEAVEARLHLFEDANETIIHNHRSNFLSYCLHGSYEHRIYKANTSKEGVHYATNRSRDPTLQEPAEKREGVLEVELVHMHQQGLTYFISANSHHTVLAESDEPVLTLYVKTVRKAMDTTVLHHEAQPDWGDRAAVERDLTPNERKDLLCRIRALVSEHG